MKIFIIINVCLLLINIVPVYADQIFLKNGDRISGTIVRKDSESVIIKTSYAGDISINWENVSSFQSDAKIQTVLTDGTTINGIVIHNQPGNVIIKSGENLETDPISLNQIAAINPSDMAASPVILSGHANVGLSMTKGNTDTQNIYVDIEFVVRTLNNRFTVGGTHNKDETNGIESENDLTGYMKYDYFFAPKWYYLANAIFNKNKFKDVELKTAMGIGAGYQLWESPEKNLSAELGLNYVNEDYIVAKDNDYPAGRWALNFDQLLFDKTAQFFHKHEILMGLEQVDDISILSQTGLRFHLLKKINATFQVNLDWDNTPAPDKKSSDIDYLISLGYSW